MEEIKFDGPGSYLIRVQADHDIPQMTGLEYMSVQVSGSADKQKVITLVGKVENQFLLAKILKKLHDQHLPLLSVEHLNQNGFGT